MTFLKNRLENRMEHHDWLFRLNKQLEKTYNLL